MFQFKQFKIEQDKAGMKVTTDACIFGAYLPVEEKKRIVDIGTGTGLLALMMAQRSYAQIEAVELDDAAFEQADDNVRNSKFSNQVTVVHQAIQSYAKAHLQEYDLVISNPPFFNNHLKSSKETKNKALHTDTLSFDELLDAAKTMMAITGTFVVLLPEYESSLLVEMAQKKGLYQQRRFVIRHRKDAKILRIITTFGFDECMLEEEEFVIKNQDETYTEAFACLLGAYYLIF